MKAFRSASHALLAAVSLTAVPAALAQSAAPEQVAAAERLAQIASTVLDAPDADAVPLRMAGAVLDAAIKLNPNEKRFARSAIDLALRQGDRDKAIELLGVYRKLDPADELAQVQAIDLFVDRMQTAEARADYLQKVVSAEAVAPAIRAHAAVAASIVLRDRGQLEAADALLARALELNPLNPKALQTRYEQTLRTGTPADRVKALAALLNSNPGQPAVMNTLAEELFLAGAFDEAQKWYGRALDLSQQTGNFPAADDLVNYAGALLQTGETGGAGATAAALLKIQPTNLDGFQLKLLAEKADAAMFAESLADARRAATLRLNLAAALADLPRDAKLPEIAPDAALIDLRVAAKKIKDNRRDDLAPAFAAAVADLAWLDLYYDRKAPPADRVEALATLLGNEHPVVSRVAGWSALRNNQAGEARVKLSAVAERDPLSKLGEILLGDPAAPATKTALAELAAKHPLGITGVVLRASAAEAAAPLTPRADVADLRAAAATVPDQWLEILRNPRGFYTLRAEPKRVGFAYAQPMLVDVSITSNTDTPLTVGPGGIISSTVVIDASIKGVVQQYIPAVATVRLGGKLVLPPRGAISATVRVDRGAFDGFVSSNPAPAVTVYLSALTNPTATENSIIGGPAGYRAQATRVVERSATPVASPEARKAILERLPKLDPESRLRQYELLAQLCIQLRGQGQPSPEAQAVLDQFDAALNTARTADSSAELRAFASFFSTQALDKTAQAARIKEMAGSTDPLTRLLAVAASINQSKVDRVALLAPLQNDADELVKRFAQATSELPDPPATQPATTPGTDAPAPPDAPTTDAAPEQIK